MTRQSKNQVMVFNASYDAETLAGVVDAVFDAFPMELKGRKVLVKPNILAGEPPEKGVTTHPFLVKAVVDKLKQEGAEVMVGDNPGVYGYGISEKAAEKAKIRDAAGDCFIHLGRSPVKQALSSGGLDHVMIAGDVLTADLVINLPKLKTHSLTFYTGALKNTFGYVVGGDKMRVHSQASTARKFAEALVDIYAIRPPELTIMDAITVMEGNGPHHGNLRHLGKVLAGRNGVCLDAVAVHMIGTNPRAVPHLSIAAERGLGTIDISSIHVNAPIVPLTDFKMPGTFVPGVAVVVLNWFLSPWLRCLPEIDGKKCKQCGLCVKHCPVEAMRMEKGMCPAADKKTCINCYCCQEMCPKDAIVLKGRLINLIRGTTRP